jgi:hypothetical protein
MTEDGQRDLMNKLLESGRSRWNINQIATDKVGAFDLPSVFTPTDAVKPPVASEPEPEQVFQEAVGKLEQQKRYLDLGLITKEQYDIELAKVKALMPK